MEDELRDNEEIVKFENTSKQFFKEIEENKNPQKLEELSESLLIQFIDCFEKAAKDKDDYNMKKNIKYCRNTKRCNGRTNERIL